MPLRTTPLLSSKAPLVNSRELTLPVLTSVGEWAHLTASRTQWHTIVVDLARALGLDVRPIDPPAAAPKRRVEFIVAPDVPRAPVRKPSGRIA